LTIICFKDGIMAADGMSCSGDQIVNRSVQKIFRYPDGSLAAGTGVTTTIWRVHRYFTAQGGFHHEYGDRIPVDLAGVEQGDLTLLVVKPDGKVFMVFFDGDVREIPREIQIIAIGQGDDFAMGAMNMGASSEQAVKLVCENYAHCGGEIQVERLNPEPEDAGHALTEGEPLPKGFHDVSIIHPDQGVVKFLENRGLR
jgi:ATP-dependent protease HslVU (ClpYQ) peptidase subunit